ncbi:hypothetical protein GSI_11923 [Ganoderma sinense ZZ0214-1]|uniref:Uncharacterized protein n=1 Tax=Ganoderma sinense ZZ0214-1 TaxID=1077348 RepID=A0A2G8RXX4_9APHY|nr:hypothetical protein GSI_11923 [Ganoderma sinense ZZ0214-1]
MPHLTSLRVSDVSGAWFEAGHTISFGHIEELFLAGDVPALVGIFNCFCFPALKAANIYFTSLQAVPVAPEGVTAFLYLFHNAVSASSLHSLELTIMPAQPPGRELPAIRDRLAPILPLRDLRAFVLGVSRTIATFDDADVDALARAWPNMERLSIGQGSKVPESMTNVSFDALYCLYRYCPRLEELSIPRIRWPTIGVHSVPAPIRDGSQATSGPPGTRKPHPLRRFTVRDEYFVETMRAGSPAPELSDEAAEAMARYILDLFPRLEPEQYKKAASEARKASDAEARQRGNLESIVRFDGRWRQVSGLVYVLCCARDGLPTST